MAQDTADVGFGNGDSNRDEVVPNPAQNAPNSQGGDKRQGADNVADKLDGRFSLEDRGKSYQVWRRLNRGKR